MVASARGIVVSLQTYAVKRIEPFPVYEIWTVASLSTEVMFRFSYDVQDRVGGGRETYKTQVSLYSDGTNIWRSPAMFNSLCDVDVTYFPFDVQSCILKFGSWSRPTSEMRTVPETIHANSTNYIENGEWQLISQTWRRNVVPYRGGRLHFDDVTLTIKIGRQYHTYFINLVIPCALISTMIFLSFLLPPECGERISLGITVLLAMTVFQQLTQQLFPSFDIPLLGQYYMATILEISMALAATTLVLNFKFRNSTRMPGWLRKLFLTRLSRLVGLKATVDKSRPKRTTRKTLRRTLYDPSDADAHDERRFVQELKDALQDSTRNHEAIDLHLNRSVNDISAKHGVFAVPPTTYGQQDSDDDVFEPSGVRDENGQEMNEDELAFRQWEWNMAANILDRFALGLSVVIGVVTFLAIFFQAPAIRAHFPWDAEQSAVRSSSSVHPWVLLCSPAVYCESCTKWKLSQFVCLSCMI